MYIYERCVLFKNGRSYHFFYDIDQKSQFETSWMLSKLSLVFYDNLSSVPGKTGLCHMICHIIDSFRGARCR